MTIMEKLKSRKLWMAVLAAAGAIAAAVFGDELTPEAVGMLETAVKAAVAYICGEGAVDAARLIAGAIRERAQQ